MDESGGERGGNDVERIGLVVVLGGVDVGTEIAEGDVEVAIGVKVRERKDVIMVEAGWLKRVDCGGF